MNVALLMLKGMLSEMPKEELEKVEAAKAEIDAVVAAHGDYGLVALGWVGIEKQS